MKLRSAYATTLTNTSTTHGGVDFCAFVCAGSAGASTFTIKDGTDTKFVFSVAITTPVNFSLGCRAVGFTNLNITASGTASYNLVLAPRP